MPAPNAPVRNGACRRARPRSKPCSTGCSSTAHRRRRDRAAGTGCWPRCGTACSTAASGCAHSWSWKPPRCSTRTVPTPRCGRGGARMRALLFADPRRPAGDGRRRSAARPADRAQGLRRGDRHPCRRRLLTLAFDIIAATATSLPAPARLELVAGAGAGGRRRRHGRRPGARPRGRATPPDEAGIITLQAMKTGALIRFACEAGAIAGGAGGDDRERLGRIRRRRSGSPSSSPTTCSTSPPMPRRWARRPARTPPPARRRWSPCMARTGRAASSRVSSNRRRPCSSPYGERALLLQRGGGLHRRPHARLIRDCAPGGFRRRRERNFNVNEA